MAFLCLALWSLLKRKKEDILQVFWGSIYIRWNSFLLYLGNKKLLRYAICDAVSIIGKWQGLMRVRKSYFRKGMRNMHINVAGQNWCFLCV